jgi:hypothetical protein
MNLLNEKEAMEQSYKNLIDTYQGLIDECVNKYNAQMNRNAMLEINKDLKEHDCNIGLQFKEQYYIPELESQIKDYESIIGKLQESKKRLLK